MNVQIITKRSHFDIILLGNSLAVCFFETIASDHSCLIFVAENLHSEYQSGESV